MSAEIKTKRLFVGNLSFSTQWYELKDHFKQAGNVTYANIILDRRSKRSRGCGIVEMETLEQAQQAVKTLHETELAGRKIFVREDQRPEGADQPKEVKQKGQTQEKKPRVPKEKKEQGEKKEQPVQQGEKKPQEKKEKAPKKEQGEKKAAPEKKESKTEEKKDTTAPTTTSAVPASTTGEAEKKKKKKRRSKKKKTTEGAPVTTGDATTTTTTTTAPKTEKKEGDDGEGEFREIKRRERRGRGGRGGQSGAAPSTRGEKKPRIPREKSPTTEGKDAPVPRPKKERAQPDPSKSSGKAIFVSNLPLTMKSEELNQLFAEVGAIASSELKADKSGNARGLATVLFETPEAAQKAITTVNEKEVGGRKVNVRLDFYQ